MVYKYEESMNAAIGGERMMFEIDECHDGYQKKQHRACSWPKIIFGGICRGSKKIFMTIVVNKTKETLGWEIVNHIWLYTNVYSDKWLSYIHFFWWEF